MRDDAGATWYFDFISPFAYLQFQHLDGLPGGVPRLQPVLFAGLLQHWGQLGPAEIPAKRRFTYRYVVWRARREGIALRFPPAHPFQPLAPLRLALALGAEPRTVGTIFDFVWREGRDPVADWDALCARLELAPDEALALVADPDHKAALRRNTAGAVEAGVFGVPTLVVDGELFWGADATDMARAWLSDRAAFEDAEMRRASDLPAAVQRRLT
jgi:2-hydroxychromene-2-carboxylate isomerase